MKVVVCGAGQVGYAIASHLANEQNDVTLIDSSSELIQRVNNTLDVQGLVGFASHPDVLKRAGAGDADMLIAVTHADEVNMVACQVAHSLFDVPTKIARIRHQSYLQPGWNSLFTSNNLPIDVIISPEIEVAKAIERRLQVPGPFDTIPFADNLVHVVGIQIFDSCPVIDTPLQQLTELFPDLNIVVVGIVRDDRMIVPQGVDSMLSGDQVYFACDTTHMNRALSVFGFEEPEARRVVIVGGGNIGLDLAVRLENDHPGMRTKLIELKQERAEFAADNLEKTVVIHGSALDQEILAEANASAAEAIIAVTDDDEVNILSSLLAKRSGCYRAISLVNNADYTPLMGSIGIDVAVNPRATTISTILQHVRRGRIRAVYSLRDGLAEVIEAEALETSSIVGQQLKDARLPDGIIVGAIVRDGDVVVPRGNTVVRVGDRVIIFALADMVRKVERLFSVRLEFF